MKPAKETFDPASLQIRLADWVNSESKKILTALDERLRSFKPSPLLYPLECSVVAADALENLFQSRGYHGKVIDGGKVFSLDYNTAFEGLSPSPEFSGKYMQCREAITKQFSSLRATMHCEAETVRLSELDYKRMKPMMESCADNLGVSITFNEEKDVTNNDLIIQFKVDVK